MHTFIFYLVSSFFSATSCDLMSIVQVAFVNPLINELCMYVCMYVWSNDGVIIKTALQYTSTLYCGGTVTASLSGFLVVAYLLFRFKLKIYFRQRLFLIHNLFPVCAFCFMSI